MRICAYNPMLCPFHLKNKKTSLGRAHHRRTVRRHGDRRCGGRGWRRCRDAPGHYCRQLRPYEPQRDEQHDVQGRMPTQPLNPSTAPPLPRPLPRPLTDRLTHRLTHPARPLLHPLPRPLPRPLPHQHPRPRPPRSRAHSQVVSGPGTIWATHNGDPANTSPSLSPFTPAYYGPATSNLVILAHFSRIFQLYATHSRAPLSVHADRVLTGARNPILARLTSSGLARAYIRTTSVSATSALHRRRLREIDLEGTATSTRLLTNSYVFLSSRRLDARRVSETYYTSCPCVLAEWCLRSDVMADPHLQAAPPSTSPTRPSSRRRSPTSLSRCPWTGSHLHR